MTGIMRRETQKLIFKEKKNESKKSYYILREVYRFRNETESESRRMIIFVIKSKNIYPKVYSPWV